MDNLIIFCAKYLVFAVPLLVVWLWFKQDEKKRLELVMAVAIAGVTSLLLVYLAGSLYENPRPFIVEHIKPLVSHGNDNGFPSEHTLIAMTLTTVLYFYRRRLAYAALAMTLLIGVGRVAAHVHHGIDIIGGLALGAIAGVVGYWIAKQILKLGTIPSESAKNAKPVKPADI